MRELKSGLGERASEAASTPVERGKTRSLSGRKGQSMRRACLAIGVSRAAGLAPLVAAARAAEEIGEWASRSSFAAPEDVVILTDRDPNTPVTIPRIRQAIEALMPRGRHTDAFLLYFAGHGLRESNTRTLWLPTDWKSELRAISVELLRSRLVKLGPASLTIISDACKTLPSDVDGADLTPDAILGSGHSAGSQPSFDRFDAAHDGAAAFTVPGETPEQSRCLFSGALVEALWGQHDTAFDRHLTGKVTPGSLADYLDSRLAELGKIYGLRCQPSSTPGRPEDHVIYFDRGQPLAGPKPPAVSWPSPVKERRPVPSDRFYRIEKGGASFPPIGLEYIGRAGAVSLPSHQSDWIAARRKSEDARAIAEVQLRARGEHIAQAFKRGASDFQTDASLILEGGRACRIWSRQRFDPGDRNRWHLECEPQQAVQLVIEYDDGLFVPALVYPDRTTIATRDDAGATGWMCVTHYNSDVHAASSAKVLVDLQSGTLNPARVDRIAGEMRRQKHLNPMIGAICSYLYDYIGDRDSIRRMASFYVRRHQDIPYDIALMGELALREGERGIEAVVPAVAARCHVAGNDLPEFVVQATPEGEGRIAGFFPWLRQGWDALATLTETEQLLADAMPTLARHLRPGAFTAFDDGGGGIAIDHWQLRGWD